MMPQSTFVLCFGEGSYEVSRDESRHTLASSSSHQHITMKRIKGKKTGKKEKKKKQHVDTLLKAYHEP
jgi:hypothetical protein